MERFKNGYRKLIGINSKITVGHEVAIHGKIYICTGRGKSFSLRDDAYSIWNISPDEDYGCYAYYDEKKEAAEGDDTPPPTITVEEVKAQLESTEAGEFVIAGIRGRRWGKSSPVVNVPSMSPLGQQLMAVLGRDNYDKTLGRFSIPRPLIPQVAPLITGAR